MSEEAREARIAPSSSKPFFSLKWKTLLLVTLGLVLIHLSVVYVHYRDLVDQLETKLDAEIVRYENTLTRLFAQSRTSLSRTAAVVPRVVNTVENLSERQELWVSVQFELGLDVLQLYDVSGNLDVTGVTDWGGSSPPKILFSRVDQVLKSETPSSFLHCMPLCRHFVVQPFLNALGEANAVMVARPLIDIILEFPQLAGAEIAVLGWQGRITGGEQIWGRTISGLSNAPDNAPLLKRVEQRHDLDAFDDGLRITLDQRDYQFVTLRMQRFDGDEHSQFLVFSDITDALNQIERQIRDELLLGLLTLLATYAVLLFVLNRPLKHLQLLARVFPLLATDGYDEVRRNVGQAYLRRKRHDEVDVLDAATVSLANQLEEMQQAIAARSGGLAERLKEITTERRIVHTLLESSPQPVFLLNNEGMITRMSPSAAALSDDGGSRFLNTPFLSHFADPGDASNAADTLMQVLAGQVGKAGYEGSFRAVDDGNPIALSWQLFHIGDEGRSHVLCIGDRRG